MHVCNAVYHPALTPIVQLELSLRNLHSPSTRFLISASVLCVINRFRKQGRKKVCGGCGLSRNNDQSENTQKQKKASKNEKIQLPKRKYCCFRGGKKNDFSCWIHQASSPCQT